MIFSLNNPNFYRIPERILVKKEEAFRLLEPITSHLGITLKKVKKLPVFEEVKAEMSAFYIRRNDS